MGIVSGVRDFGYLAPQKRSWLALREKKVLKLLKFDFELCISINEYQLSGICLSVCNINMTFLFATLYF